MKKQKMIMTLAGLLAVVATSTVITAYSLAGDGSSADAGESGGTQEPGFDVDGPAILDPAPHTIYDGKGGVSVINPDVNVDDTPPLHGDPEPSVVRTGSGTSLFMDPLLAAGEVKLTGEVVSEGIFSVDGRVLEVNGERVLVMDYGDAAALEAEAAGISPSGSSIGPTEDGSVSMVTWVGPPHFFRTETAIVLYVGESPTVIEALTKMMGPQFAGR